MAEIKINNEISKLKDLAKYGIDNENFSEIKDTLNIIKRNKTSKEQLKEIIAFLNEQAQKASSKDITQYHHINQSKKDFESLLENYSEEKASISEEVKNRTHDEKITSISSNQLSELSEIEKSIKSKWLTNENAKKLSTISKSATDKIVLNKINEINESILKWNTKTESVKTKVITKKVNTEVKKIEPKDIKELFNDTWKKIEVKKNELDQKVKEITEEIWIPNTKNDTTTTNLVDKKENNETKLINDSLIYKNWKNYIIWKEWIEKEISFNDLNPEAKKELEKAKNVSEKLEDFILLLNAFPNKSKVFYDELNKLFEKWDIEGINKLIDSTIDWTYKNSWATLPWNKDKEKELKDIFAKTWDERKLAVLDFLRKEWNSEVASQELINRNFNKTKLTSNDLEELKKLALWNKDEALKTIMKSSESDNNYLSKFKYLFQNEENLKSLINEIHNADEKAWNIIEREKKKSNTRTMDSKYTDALKNDIIDAVIKKESLNALITNNVNYTKTLWYKWNDKELEMLWSIEWLWYFKVSDSSEELIEILAIEWVAIIAWTLSAGIREWVIHAIAWARYLKRVERLLASESKIKKAYIWAEQFVSSSITQGSSFYAWYAWAQSLLEWENMYSLKWLWESIAFMWAFKWLNAVYSKSPLKLDSSKSLKEQKLKITSQMFIDGTAFSVVSLWFNGILFEPGEWTAEEILQAFIMAWVFRWIAPVKWWTEKIAEKLKVSKWENGEIKMETETADFTADAKWNAKNNKEEISEKEFEEFYKTWKVSNAVLSKIIGKIKNFKELSEQEKDIYKKHSDIIETKLKEIKDFEDFKELLKLDKESLTKILRNFDIHDMALAMKTAKPEEIEKIKSCLSNKAKQRFDEEFNNIKNISIEEVNNAQKKFLEAKNKPKENKEKLKKNNNEIDIFRKNLKKKKNELNKLKQSQEYTEELKELENIKQLYKWRENDALNHEEKIKYLLSWSAKNWDIISHFESKLKSKTAKIESEIKALETKINNLQNKENEVNSEKNKTDDIKNNNEKIWEKEDSNIKEEIKETEASKLKDEENDNKSEEKIIDEEVNIWSNEANINLNAFNDKLSKKVSSLLDNEISKLKIWESKEFWDFKVSIKKDWEYEIDNLNFKNKKDLLTYINETKLNSSKSVFDFINKNLEINYKKSINKEINVWDKTYRISEDWTIQEKWEYNSWKNVERDLNDTEMDAIWKIMFDSKFNWYNFKKNAEQVKPENLMSKSEKDWIITKYWKAWYNKIVWWLNEFKWAIWSWTKWTFKFFTWLWESTTTYKWAILWTAAMQWIQIWTVWWDNYINNFHWKDWAEIVWEILALRYMWLLKWSIWTWIYSWVETGAIQEMFFKENKTPTTTETHKIPK